MSSEDLFTKIADLEESTWRALTKSGEAMVPFITTGKPDGWIGRTLHETPADPSARLVLQTAYFNSRSE